MFGKNHTSELRATLSKAYTGRGHPQYGWKWITNGIENKKIPPDSIILDNWKIGRTKTWKTATANLIKVTNGIDIIWINKDDLINHPTFYKTSTYIKKGRVYKRGSEHPNFGKRKQDNKFILSV